MDQFVHSCHLCIGPCCLDSCRIDVKALDIRLNIKIYPLSGFFSCIFPAFLRDEMFPALSQEVAVHSRCHIRCHHCRLNGKGTTSAERIHENTVFFPRGQHQKCAGKCLCDGCFHGHLAVSSLMKRYAGSIDPDQGHIFHKCHTDWEFRTVFREPGNSVDAFETFYDGFFHDGLDIGWAEKFTLDGVCLGYPEFTVLRYVILPWESLSLLKKFVECLGFYFAYFQKDAFCGAEEQIGVCHTLGVCLKSYSSVFHFGHFITKVQYFTFQYRLCSEMAGRC